MRTRRYLLALSLALLTNGCASQTPDYNGQTLYLANCANCHGTYGEGDGAVTPNLNVVLQDLRYVQKRNNGEFPRAWLKEIIDGRGHGPVGMPVWGAVFSKQEGYDDASQARVSAKIDALLSYLEMIQVQPDTTTN